MLRVNALLTRRVLLESNAFLQRCVFRALTQEQAITGGRMQLDRRTCSSVSESVPSSPSQFPRSCITSAQFELIWWDKGSDSGKGVSIWQPKPPPGCAVLGDCLVEGLEPPKCGVGLLDVEPGILTKPTTYLSRVHISGKGLEDVYIWFPVAREGYVAMGCIATKTQQMPPVDQVWCIRSDYVTQANFAERPIWSTQDKYGLWKVNAQAHTFIAQANLERPPTCLANYIGNRNCRDDSRADTRHNSAADKPDRSGKRYSQTAGKTTSEWGTTRTSLILVLLGGVTVGSYFPVTKFIVPIAKACAHLFRR